MMAPIHWMIQERDPELGIPLGRIACGLSPSFPWSVYLSRVTCRTCRQKFFSLAPADAAGQTKPITD